VRIVSLLPSASEIVCALGLGDSLVAVSHECDFPPEVKALPRVTSSILPHDLDVRAIDEAVRQAVREGRALYKIDGDLLARLKPDLIVTQGVCDVCAVSVGTVEETLRFLPDVLPAGTQTLSLSGTSVAGVWRDIERVGAAAGVPGRAAALVGELRARWARLERLPKPAARPRVAMLEWPDPPFYGGHWVPEQVAAAGGEDVLGRPGEVSARVTWAQLHEADPDVVVMVACGYDLAANRTFAAALYEHPEALKLRAVRQGAVWAADANSFFSRPAPRLVRGAELLYALLSGQSLPPREAAHVPHALSHGPNRAATLATP
jgi:iron complex transport system substrate-binding protein